MKRIYDVTISGCNMFIRAIRTLLFQHLLLHHLANDMSD